MHAHSGRGRDGRDLDVADLTASEALEQKLLQVEVIPLRALPPPLRCHRCQYASLSHVRSNMKSCKF